MISEHLVSQVQRNPLQKQDSRRVNALNSGRVHAGSAEAYTSMFITRQPFNSDIAFRHLRVKSAFQRGVGPVKAIGVPRSPPVPATPSPRTTKRVASANNHPPFCGTALPGLAFPQAAYPGRIVSDTIMTYVDVRNRRLAGKPRTLCCNRPRLVVARIWKVYSVPEPVITGFCLLAVTFFRVLVEVG